MKKLALIQTTTLFLVAWALMSTTAIAKNQCSITEYKGGFEVVSQDAVLYIADSGEGLYISKINKLGKGSADLLASEAEIKYLWKVHLRSSLARLESVTSERLKSKSKIETLPNGGHSLQLSWEGMRALDIAVTVTVTVRPDDPLIRMRISVDNNSAYSISQVDFPVLSGIGPLSDKPQDDKLIWPRATGQLLPNPYKSHIEYDEGYHYPSFTQAMQVTGVYGQLGGLYLGAYDPDCWAKRIKVYPSLSGQSLDYYLENYPENIGIAGNDYNMHYDAVVGTFDGDWWVAAQMYRNWALKQRWCRPMNVAEDKNFPDQMKEVSLWLVLNHTAEEVGKLAQSIRDYFGVKCIMHQYRWNDDGDFSEGPDYFPAKEGFKSVTAKLQRAGIEVMPYINTHLWDASAKSFVPEDGVSAATRLSLGSGLMPARSYGNHAFIQMCPKSSLWQDKMAQTCDKLFNEYGVGGIYLDQLSAVSQEDLCFGGHGHRRGGGNYIAEGGWEMLDKIKKRMPDKHRFLTSEYFCEAYIAKVDGFLVWMCFAEDTIPFAQAVYGGKTIFWGRSFGTHWGNGLKPDNQRADPEGFYSKFADILTSGVQPGWFYGWMMEDDFKEQRAFARDLVHLYDASLKDAYLDGQYIKPPAITGLGPDIKTVWPQRRLVNMVLPPVLTSAWKLSDGSYKVLAINITRQEENFRFDLEDLQHGLRAKTIVSTPDCKKQPLESVAGELSLSLQPHQAVVVSLDDYSDR